VHCIKDLAHVQELVPAVTTSKPIFAAAVDLSFVALTWLVQLLLDFLLQVSFVSIGRVSLLLLRRRKTLIVEAQITKIHKCK
jgi:hypothetical protein